MYKMALRFKNIWRPLFLLAAIFIVFSPKAAMTANWADQVENELFKKTPRTLNGKAFLDHPVSGATVMVCDSLGHPIHTVETATDDDGSFSIAWNFPKSFWVVISNGLLQEEAFDHEIIRYIPEFDENTLYKINAITTLLGYHMERHPEAPYSEAKEAVAAFLSLSESTTLDDIIFSSEWRCYQFSHYLFMRESDDVEGGMTSFAVQLLDELDEGNTRSFYDLHSIASVTFGNIMKFLLQGALKKGYSEGLGWVLNYLNIGGDDADSRLDEMDGKIDQVIQDLDSIKKELDNLVTAFEKESEEIKTLLEGDSAKDAISVIKTHYSGSGIVSLTHFASLRDPDEADKEDIGDLVNGINVEWDIASKVQIIYDAICPEDPVSKGVLNRWTDYLITFYTSEQCPNFPDESLMNSYLSLEKYFAWLAFYQLQGVSLMVEAQNYDYDPDTNQTEEGTTPGKEILDDYQPKLQAETDRFMQCVLKLIVSNCNLNHQDEFLSQTAEEILARATFFSIQVLGEEESDDFGLRLGAFGTENLVDDITALAALHKTGILEIEQGEKLSVDVADKPYDFWGTLESPNLASLGKGTSYQLLQADLGSFDPGTYETGCYIGADKDTCHQTDDVVVKKYTSNYFEDTDGEITYGYNVTPYRIGGWEAMMDRNHFYRDQYTVSKDGDVESGFDEYLFDDFSFYLDVRAHNHYTNSSSSINQKLEWSHNFRYEGDESATARVHMTGHVQGHTYFRHENTWNNTCFIESWVGLYDKSAGSIIGRCTWHLNATEEDVTQNLDTDFDCSFDSTLQPDQDYYIFVNVQGSGHNNSGDYNYEIALDRLDDLSLSFFIPQSDTDE